MSGAVLATSFLQDPSFLDILYIVAFGMFIQGLRGLSGPTTAVRGNRIAAVGMAIAVIATLLNAGEGNWALIVIGVAIGTAVGVPAARQVKMTAMPQMVALFNGVGGGAVFLISWAEFRLSDGFTATPTYIAIFSLFAAIVGSVSFWGSNIAFGKLQELISGKCVAKCPAGAIEWNGRTILIDHEKCIAYGPSCNEACSDICPSVILHRVGQSPRPELVEIAEPSGVQ